MAGLDRAIRSQGDNVHNLALDGRLVGGQTWVEWWRRS